MDSDFLVAFRSAIEGGDFRPFADLYAADATFEGFLPGGVRAARGPGPITGMLADELGPAAQLVEMAMAVLWLPGGRDLVAEADDVHHGHRPAEALELELPDLLDLDPRLDQRVRPRAQQDLARARR
jgi:hypothetical protein